MIGLQKECAISRLLLRWQVKAHPCMKAFNCIVTGITLPILLVELECVDTNVTDQFYGDVAETCLSI